MDREWEKQELEAMERLALSRADRSRWDSLDPKGLLPSRVARRLAGLKYLAGPGDPFAEYEPEISAAFRAPFEAGAEERAESAGPQASSTEDMTESRPGFLPLRRKRKEKRRLFRR